ncbi:PQQ-binding-like beta-propeller repeat protein [Solitalea sp. MAHUQ-68]|uniref:PQQ-binding-like beta-propeller repeat protein n=1 Tax=Solitalea agri TaxID=2953739 RepID=A0A9X2F3V2_9SPHI|nr:PQQ-binding-like beta-propeller repeat protein [Solitalea agri]MCO4294272.1 PQQ-binding-like beta-propeller repeat protein [Solitalea agri]
MKIRFTVLFLLLLTTFAGKAQNVIKFAFVTDTHVGNSTGADDLRRTVQDINNDPSLAFVVLTGDITEFGADQELKLAKQILDSLNKKYYVIPGNHDANWSESGANTFRTVFGNETFSFTYGNYFFVATSSGPNMRMGPGQIPRENIVWLDSTLKAMPDRNMPVVYLNHYPQNNDQNNWYEALDLLKKRNVQVILHGHGHANKEYTYENIPAIMGRSNLRAKDSIGGYNIVTIQNNRAVFEVKTPLTTAIKKWAEVSLFNHHYETDTTHFTRPSYAVNKQYAKLKKTWEYQDNSDVGAGSALIDDLLLNVNTQGLIYALNKKSGKVVWKTGTKGKIYSTPAVQGTYAVVGSSNHHIYCLNTLTGKIVWDFQADKAVLGSPVIKGDNVFIGASDGHFRALNLKTGKLVWDFDQVKGFVVTKPLIYNNKIYFGCWANDFYALDIETGKLVWKWNNGTTNRMFSPAACYPAATANRVFIVAPDRYMTAFDANSGAVIWRKQMKDIRVRESMGLSADSSMVYAKTMEGQLVGISTKADSMQVIWKSKLQLPYELAPSAIVERNNKVYVPSHSGLVSTIDRNSGEVIWQYKVSNSLVNTVLPIDNNKVIVSTMDGKIVCLEYRN